MSKLHDLFPNAEALLELTPETLAPILLQIAASDRQRGMFWPSNVLQVTIGSGMSAERQHAYPHHKQQQVDALVGETWELLRRAAMIHPHICSLVQSVLLRTLIRIAGSLSMIYAKRNVRCLRLRTSYILSMRGGSRRAKERRSSQ
jgi:hypothetical protein